MKRGDAGFTLLEVLVALMVGSVVLLAARWIAGSVADATERVATERTAADTEANSERMLRRLAAAAEGGTGAAVRGNARAVMWSSWCDTAAGWQERCAVELAILQRAAGVALVVSLPGKRVVVVRDGAPQGRFRYLAEAGGRGVWTEHWTSSLPPIAVAAELGTDTLILPMRGAF